LKALREEALFIWVTTELLLPLLWPPTSFLPTPRTVTLSDKNEAPDADASFESAPENLRIEVSKQIE